MLLALLALLAIQIILFPGCKRAEPLATPEFPPAEAKIVIDLHAPAFVPVDIPVRPMPEYMPSTVATDTQLTDTLPVATGLKIAVLDEPAVEKEQLGDTDGIAPPVTALSAPEASPCSGGSCGGKVWPRLRGRRR